MHPSHIISRCFLGTAEKSLLRQQLVSRIAQDPSIFDADGLIIPSFLEDLINACLRDAKGTRETILTRLRQIVTSREIAKIFNAIGIESGRCSYQFYFLFANTQHERSTLYNRYQ